MLAAGSASRMGRQKVTLAVAGRPMVRRAVEALYAIAARRIHVVVNSANAEAVRAALAGLPVRLIVNEEFRDGIGSSIAVGAAALDADARAMLLVQGDQPFVSAQLLQQLVDVWARESPPFVASRYDGVVTTPVLFDRKLLPELLALEGDVGARQILRRHAEDGRIVDFPAWCGADVDTEEDYERVRELIEGVGQSGSPFTDEGRRR